MLLHSTTVSGETAMMRLVLFVVELFLLLPWWAATGILVCLAFGLWALAQHLVHRFRREVAAAVMAQGEPLTDALVTVESVEPAEPPTTASPLDAFDDEYDDPDDDPEMDETFATDDFAHFWIEATIAPQDSQAVWDPSVLALVPADFQPDAEFEFSAQTGLLHTLEVWRDGRFQPQGSQNVTGTQRLKMLFAVPLEVRQAKFAYHFTHFGRIALPASLALAR
jgi:hypothetical protein